MLDTTPFYSITGFAYLALSLSVGFLSYRIYKYWQKVKDFTSKAYFYISFFFFLFGLTRATGGLFFANNQDLLADTIRVGMFFQTFIFALLAYYIFYGNIPNISPWWGFIPIFILGLISIILTTISPYKPFLEPSGAINWGTFSVSSNILRTFLFLVTFLPAIVLFLRRFKNAEDSVVKSRTVGFTLVLLFGMLVSLFDFLVINTFKLDAIWRDVLLFILSITIFILLIPSRKAEPNHKEI